MLNNIPILSIVAYVPLVGALAIVFLVPREKAADDQEPSRPRSP